MPTSGTKSRSRPRSQRHDPDRGSVGRGWRPRNPPRPVPRRRPPRHPLTRRCPPGPPFGLNPRGLALSAGSIVAVNKAGATVLMVEKNVRFGLSRAQHATVMRAGAVALTGPSEEIPNHPHLMDVFFGAAKPHTRAHGDQQGH